MSEEAAIYARRVRRAAQLLFFKRHGQPGVKGWELRRSLGRNYMKVIELLNARLEDLGLEVRTAYEGQRPQGEPEAGHLDSARFYVSLRDPLTKEDLRLSGWRVDDVAALTVTVAYIVSRGGKALRSDAEQILRQKFPKWRVELNIDRFKRRGYFTQDEEGLLHLGWRARTEIDQKALLSLVLGREIEPKEQPKPTESPNPTQGRSPMFKN